MDPDWRFFPEMAMNTAFVSGLTILAASISLASTATFADDTCVPHTVQSTTTFPMRSQLRGHEGTVYLNVKIDETGRVRSADLQQSSGFRLLDRAAVRSVISNWVFDISGCARKDLPASHLVAVEYRNDVY
jgi:TonB family protein